ncbi:MAG: glycosyltransferase [Bacteroidales bacterium]|nr:glycosyltransferase [Bacteroidales bacterium]
MFFFSKEKQLPTDIVEHLQNIRLKSDVLSICPKPTGYSWLGVQVASLSLFPDCTFQIPQNFSNQLLTDEQLQKLSNLLNELNFKQIVFNGFLPYFGKIIDRINIQTKIKVVYHGFLSELSGNKKQIDAFNSMLTYVGKNRISAIGCVKKGLALSLSKLYSVPTFEIILPNRCIVESVRNCDDNLNIGVLVNTSFRKNIHNQAVATIMKENSILHTFRANELSYLPQDRIKYYDLMSHDEFVDLLSKMTINLHITFSESWGQVLSESISMGVPCISAYTSSFFDYDEDLKRKLVVEGFDDSWHIYKKIEEVLKDRESIGRECIAYAKLLNVLSQERLTSFLDA